MALLKRHRLVLWSLVNVAVVVAAKLVAHRLGWEGISLNPLFSGLVAANVFLMGFLLSGVLADYKESERLPGEVSVILETLTDDFTALREPKHAEVRRDGLAQLHRLASGLQEWFYKRQSTADTMAQVADLVALFGRVEPFVPANYTVRLKQEQSNLRRCLIRIHTIRETSFIPSGYVISEIVTVMLTIGLVLVRIDKLHEALFFVGMITFLFSFLGLLIRDLDNPFGYYEENSAEDVSLKPLTDATERLRRLSPPA